MIPLLHGQPTPLWDSRFERMTFYWDFSWTSSEVRQHMGMRIILVPV